MNIEIINAETTPIAKLATSERAVNTVQDAIDLMGNADYQGARNVLVHEDNLHPDFFNLRTGLAGEILQKYSNYRMKLAIVGDFGKYESKALQAFIIECNRGSHIFFVADEAKGIARLSG